MKENSRRPIGTVRINTVLTNKVFSINGAGLGSYLGFYSCSLTILRDNKDLYRCPRHLSGVQTMVEEFSLDHFAVSTYM